MKSDRRHIPNRLKIYRKSLRYRQRHVAHLLGLHSTAQLSQWEQGVSMPSSVHLIKLAILYRTIPFELYYDLFQELKADIEDKQEDLFLR